MPTFSTTNHALQFGNNTPTVTIQGSDFDGYIVYDMSTSGSFYQFAPNTKYFALQVIFNGQFALVPGVLINPANNNTAGVANASPGIDFFVDQADVTSSGFKISAISSSNALLGPQVLMWSFQVGGAQLGGPGTVYQVATTPRLTGGPITTTGTLDLATSGVTPGTKNGLTYDAYGRVTGTPSGNLSVDGYTIDVSAGATTNQVLQYNGASFVAAAVSSGVSSVSNADGTLTISPTSGSVVASLNVSHANTWGAKQTFSSGISNTGAFFYSNSILSTAQSPYTIQPQDNIIIVRTDNGSIQINLPASINRSIRIADSYGYTDTSYLILNAPGGGTINGRSSINYKVGGSTIELYCFNGLDWGSLTPPASPSQFIANPNIIINQLSGGNILFDISTVVTPGTKNGLTYDTYGRISGVPTGHLTADGYIIDISGGAALDQTLRYNGSSFVPSSATTGVTAIYTAAGSPPRLTGGPITTSGTLDLAMTGVLANTKNGLTFDAYGRILATPSGHLTADGYTIDISGGALFNQALQYNGTSFVAATVGTVTSIATTPRLTGGPITTSGTLDLTPSGVAAGTKNGLTYDAYGRVTGTPSGNLSVDGYTIDVSGGAISGQSLVYNGLSFVPTAIGLDSYGHIQTSGATTLASVSALGQSTGAGSSVLKSIDATDISGTITVTIATSGGGSDIAQATFGSSYARKPRIVITPEDTTTCLLWYTYGAIGAIATGIGPYTGFKLFFNTAHSNLAAGTYIFSYLVLS